MATDRTGGPAFPNQWYDRDSTGAQVVRESFPGTLRDWFAGQALQGLLACLSTEFACVNLADEMEYRGDPPRRPEWTLARTVYHYADAMIEERDKEAENERQDARSGA